MYVASYPTSRVIKGRNEMSDKISNIIPIKVYNYKTHEEIPPYMASYVSGVADVKDVRELYLSDINDFLNGLIEWTEEQV